MQTELITFWNKKNCQLLVHLTESALKRNPWQCSGCQGPSAMMHFKQNGLQCHRQSDGYLDVQQLETDHRSHAETAERWWVSLCCTIYTHDIILYLMTGGLSQLRVMPCKWAAPLPQRANGRFSMNFISIYEPIAYIHKSQLNLRPLGF